MTVTVTAPGMRSILGSCPAPWGAQTRSSSAPGCSWRPSTQCVDPTCWSSAGPLLDSAASSCRSLPTRLRGRCPRSRNVWHHDHGQTLARAPCALMGPIQVCRQTTGLDQRPECDHAAGDRCGNLGRRRPGFPSDFPPPNMGLRETGRNGRGRPVTTAAVGKAFAHVTSGLAGQVGMRRDSWGAGGATCKIAGIAYTGSNPVPAT
jgi:hypothetical protein